MHKEHKKGGGADAGPTSAAEIGLEDVEGGDSAKLIDITLSRSAWKLCNMALISAFPCDTEQQTPVVSADD